MKLKQHSTIGQWLPETLLAIICIIILALMLSSCAVQVERKPSGELLVNANVFSKGSVQRSADGSIDMRADNAEAAKVLGNTQLGLQGIKAAEIGIRSIPGMVKTIAQ